MNNLLNYQVEGLKTTKELIDEGGRVFFYKCDVTDSSELQKCANAINDDSRIGMFCFGKKKKKGFKNELVCLLF